MLYCYLQLFRNYVIYKIFNNQDMFLLLFPIHYNKKRYPAMIFVCSLLIQLSLQLLVCFLFCVRKEKSSQA